VKEQTYDALPPIVILIVIACSMFGWVLGREQGRLEGACDCMCAERDTVAVVSGMTCSCLNVVTETGW